MVSAAALLLLYGQMGREEVESPLSASPTPIASSAVPAVATSTPLPDRAGFAQTTAPTEAQTTADGNPVAHPPKEVTPKENIHRTALRSASRRFRRTRQDDRPITSPKFASATKPHPAEMQSGPKGAMWTTETVSHDDYRVLVPVVLTQQDPEDAGVTATPAVLEVAYDPHAATQADY
jgi:hypothetical protein